MGRTELSLFQHGKGSVPYRSQAIIKVVFQNFQPGVARPGARGGGAGLGVAA